MTDFEVAHVCAFFFTTTPKIRYQLSRKKRAAVSGGKKAAVWCFTVFFFQGFTVSCAKTGASDAVADEDEDRVPLLD